MQNSLTPKQVAQHLRAAIATEDEMTEVITAYVRDAIRPLLESLKEVVAISDRKHNAWARAHSVIAKAEEW